MIIYHVTVKVEADTIDEWLSWMKEIHIPDVLKTGHFTGYRMSRMIPDDQDGATFGIQYTLNSMENLEAYLQHHAPTLQKEHINKFEGKFIAYRTLHEIVDSGTI
jgi:antibiotic biosynthesis monooxygenase (ABM) superfamily enzyme